jgi:hypothetical protein
MDTLQGSVAADEFEFPTRISARGVIAGVLVALALEAMLMVLGAAIGLSAFQPRGDVAKGIGVGFAVWLVLTMIVSAFVGSWIASGAARAVRVRDGVLHGVVTWAAVTVIGVSLLGGAIRSTLGGIFGLAGTATQAIAASPAANQAAANAGQGGGVQQQIDKAAGNLSANSQQLAAKANQAASGAAIGSWGVFAMMLLPMLAALGGGVFGTNRERRASGLAQESPRPGRRRAVVTSPRTHGRDVPTQPLPST